MSIKSVTSIGLEETSLFYMIGVGIDNFNDRSNDKVVSIDYVPSQTFSNDFEFSVYEVRTETGRMIYLPADKFVSEWIEEKK